MTKYIWNDEEYTDRDELEDAIREYAEDSYDDMLNDVYGDIDVCGYSYCAADAFYRIDPIAYECGCNDYESSLWDDVEEVECDDE